MTNATRLRRSFAVAGALAWIALASGCRDAAGPEAALLGPEGTEADDLGIGAGPLEPDGMGPWAGGPGAGLGLLHGAARDLDLSRGQRGEIRELVGAFHREHEKDLVAMHEVRRAARSAWLDGREYTEEDAEAALQAGGVDREAFRSDARELRAAVRSVLTEAQVARLRDRLEREPPAKREMGRHRERLARGLALTGDQKAEMRGLRERFRADHAHEIASLREARRMAREAWLDGREFTKEDAGAYLESRGVDREKFRADMREHRAALRAVLTPPQIAELKSCLERRDDRPRGPGEERTGRRRDGGRWRRGL